LVRVQVAKRKKISENTEQTRVRREPLEKFSAAGIALRLVSQTRETLLNELTPAMSVECPLQGGTEALEHERGV